MWIEGFSALAGKARGKHRAQLRLCHALAVACALAVSPAAAQTTNTDIGTLDAATAAPGKPPGYSPYAGRNFPSRVFWGDTHLHTSASMDAGAFGNRLGFEDAYRFARGEELTASGGERVKLARPLDFLVIADHSDNMGFFPALLAGNPEMLADETGRRWYNMVQAGRDEGVKAALQIIDAFSRGKFPPALQFLPGSEGYRSTWEQMIAAAEKYNEPTESAPDVYSVLWKTPAMGDLRLVIYPRLPQSAAEATPHDSTFLNDAYVERWTVHAPTGLAGQTISIDGLSASRTDVLVRIERLNGESSTTRLTPSSPSFKIPAAMGVRQVAAAYLGLGVEHILLGVDHLLFVLALLMLVRGWKRIGLTVTAFTVAHSITLAAAALGFFDVPRPPVEAAIALSIALVAVEIVNSARGRESLTARLPWLVAFAFGLLHGLGFAGALSEVGLPAHAIPVALLFFNIGVELGQLIFIAAVMALFMILRRFLLGFFCSKASWSQAWLRLGGAYCIGGVASFWLLERVSGFWL